MRRNLFGRRRSTWARDFVPDVITLFADVTWCEWITVQRRARRPRRKVSR